MSELYPRPYPQPGDMLHPRTAVEEQLKNVSDGFEGDTPALFAELNDAVLRLRDYEENARRAQMAVETQLQHLNDLQVIFDQRLSNWRTCAPGNSIWGNQIELPGAARTAEDAAMVVTICGSAKFEKHFRELDRLLTLAGHVVLNLAVYPSEMGDKNWYTPTQKMTLDAIHKRKIDLSEAIVVINQDGYIGDSTRSELEYALMHNKAVWFTYLVPSEYLGNKQCAQLCPHKGCDYFLRRRPCDLCYE